MGKKILFTIALMAFMFVPAMADITVEETTDAEYLINSGFSQIFAEDVFIQKNRMLGKTIEPLYEKSENVFVRYWKKFYSYLDPAQVEADKIHHDIKMEPSFTDL